MTENDNKEGANGRERPEAAGDTVPACFSACAGLPRISQNLARGLVRLTYDSGNGKEQPPLLEERSRPQQ